MDLQGWKAEFASVFSKIWVILLYILIGIMGKFSNDLLLGRKLTFRQVVGQAGVCLFCGFLSWVLCKHLGWENYAGVICPMTTYLSDKLMLALFSIEWKTIILDVINKLL
jgi:hypothetical protein